MTVTYDVLLTNASKKANSMTITAKAANGDYSANVELGKTSTIGAMIVDANVPVTLNVKVADTNGFSDNVNQSVICYISNVDSSDKTEYAKVTNGVVTGLVQSINKVNLVVASVADTKLTVTIPLYIGQGVAPTAEPTATPTPTATATPAPTATTAPTAAPTKAPETKTGKVTASSLRVRETPVDGTVVGKLAKGTEVTITEEKDGWYKVTAGSLTGWVSGEYVELTTPSTNETATTTANLRLRKTAPSGSVLATMPKGAKVEVLEKGSDWSKVKYNGKTGYASNAYLEFEEDAVG